MAPNAGVLEAPKAPPPNAGVDDPKAVGAAPKAGVLAAAPKGLAPAGAPKGFAAGAAPNGLAAGCDAAPKGDAPKAGCAAAGAPNGFEGEVAAPNAFVPPKAPVEVWPKGDAVAAGANGLAAPPKGDGVEGWAPKPVGEEAPKRPPVAAGAVVPCEQRRHS